jgi:hypothetical protein
MGEATMRRCLVVIAACTVLSTCAGADDPAPPTSPDPTPSSSTVGTAGPIDEAGCTVPDEAFCATAVEVAEALVDRDADRLLELSRADRSVCADVAT